MNEYAQGTPCWPGLRSPSPEVSVAFYTRLFGWQSGPPAPNGYVMFSLGGKHVAGVGPLINDSQQPSWCTYLAAQDLDGTVATASSAGTHVLIAPFDVPGTGRVAVIVDPTGAEVWLWQPAATAPRLSASPGRCAGTN